MTTCTGTTTSPVPTGELSEDSLIKNEQSTGDAEPSPEQNNSDGQDPDDSDEDEGDCGEEEPLLSRLCLKEDSEKYVIMINGIPQCYTSGLGTARAYMWDIARSIKSHAVRTNNCYLRESHSQEHIQLVGCYRMVIVPYDRVLTDFSIHRIQELDELDEIDHESEDGYQEEAPGAFGSILRHITG